MKPIVESEMVKIISKFDQNKSAGHNSIGNFIIKKVVNEISYPLAAIFNLSLSTGNIPDQLKVAKEIPIFKNMHKYFQITGLSQCCHVYQNCWKD